MTQNFWKSMAFMGICFVILGGVMEILQWATAR